MGLSGAFNTAGSALANTAKYLDIISQNINGAQTQGYTRRQAISSELSINGQTLGTSVTVTRAQNDALLDNLNLATADLNKRTAIADALQALSDSIGKPDGTDSPSAYLNAFRTALETAADSPDNTSAQVAAVTAAKNLTAKIAQFSNKVLNARLTADRQLEDEVNTVNKDLTELQNIESSLIAVKGSDNAPLLDRRDQLISDINQRLPVRSYPKSDGSMALITVDSGTVLYDGGALQLGYTSKATLAPGSVYAPPGTTPSAPYAAGLSGITVNGYDILAHGTPGGRIGGLVQLRDNTLPDLMRRLDAVASTLIRVTRNVDTSGSASQDSLFTSNLSSGQPLNTIADQIGVSSTLKVNALFDPDQGGAAYRVRDGVGAAAQGSPGDASLINRMIAALTTATSFPAGVTGNDTQSLVSALNEFNARVNQDSVRANNDKTTVDSRHSTLAQSFSNATGVNVDDQLRDMQQAQQLYGASATLLKTINEMFSSLLTAIV